MPRRPLQAGFGSLIAVVVAALISVALIVLYLKSSVPSPPAVKETRTTIDGVRKQAQAVEEQQARHFRELDELAGRTPAGEKK